MKINYRKLFPEPPNKIYDFKIDEDSVSYITTPQNSLLITNIIIRECVNNLDIQKKNIIIFDGTAGVGGDTISFAKNFKNVISVEKDEKRFEMLKYNIKKFDFENVIFQNGNSLEIINDFKNINVVYFDPPWGGSDYKNNDKLQLFINDKEISQITLDIFNSHSNLELLVFKIPKNYDLENLYENLKDHYSISMCKLQKMYILMIKKHIISDRKQYNY